jgi:hypothetical protein
MIDGVGVILLGYFITKSRPAAKLGKERPTSSLLSVTNISSILGSFLINLLFLIGALSFMASQTDYVRWPAQ